MGALSAYLRSNPGLIYLDRPQRRGAPVLVPDVVGDPPSVLSAARTATSGRKAAALLAAAREALDALDTAGGGDLRLRSALARAESWLRGRGDEEALLMAVEGAAYASLEAGEALDRGSWRAPDRTVWIGARLEARYHAADAVYAATACALAGSLPPEEPAAAGQAAVAALVGLGQPPVAALDQVTEAMRAALAAP